MTAVLNIALIAGAVGAVAIVAGLFGLWRARRRRYDYRADLQPRRLSLFEPDEDDFDDALSLFRHTDEEWQR